MVELAGPTQGDPIALSSGGAPSVTDHPIIPFIEGDGIGPDIGRASRALRDAAVAKAYKGELESYEVQAVDRGKNLFDNAPNLAKP